MRSPIIISVVWLGTVLIPCSIFISLFQVTCGYQIDDNPFSHFATLDQHGKYQLHWEVDWKQKRVTFNVTVQTKGYVGLGLSKRGKMVGADVVIGGVYPDGRSYFTDRYAVANQLPESDKSQDWILHHAWERGGSTFLCFSRPFDTCDKDHDFPITDDVLTLIWSYSEVDDQLQYHFQNRGTYEVYLLDPDLVPRFLDPANGKNFKNEFGDMSVFTMRKQITLPLHDTVYWCSFHRAPTTSSKQHIIGWNTMFHSELSRNHVHHLLLYRCSVPEGVDAVSLFEGPARGEGSECYFTTMPNPLPVRYCRETIHTWAVGGKPIFFPDHVGLEMSGSGSPEYFMLQVHYDNPNLIPNLNITVDLEAYYTSNLRDNDAGLLQIGAQISGSASIVIPPASLDHQVLSHCSPGCLEKMLPDEGVNIFAISLHTHNAGRNVRLLHHRGNQELPWLMSDNNYNFNYQQFRILRQERKLFPGDHLMNRCVYDTTDRNGSVVVGGFSTREEMCKAHLYYYSRARGYGLCRSEIRTEEYWNLLGIRNTTWDEGRRQVIVTNPPQHAGLSVQEYANKYVEWDIQTREALQRHHLHDPQVSQCPRGIVEVMPTYTSSTQVGRPFQRYPSKGRFPNMFGRLAKFGSTQEDDDSEHVSVNPRGISRYRRPPQCTKDSVLSPWVTNYKGKNSDF